MRALRLGLLLLLAGCGPDAARTIPRAQQPIVGGTDDPGDPEVVALLVDKAQWCTGTLVSPTTVLTAGHCANPIGPSNAYAVGFGEDASHPTRVVKALEEVPHPQYTAEGAPYDFALVHLAEPVVDVPVAQVRRAPLSQTDVGAQIRHVGYGISDELDRTGRGTRRTSTYPVLEVDPLIVWSGSATSQTCDGDSGGPGFMRVDGGEELAGVVSDGPNCHDAGWDGRVDVVADWVMQTAAAWDSDAGWPDAGAPDAGTQERPIPKHEGCASVDGLSLFGLLASLLLLRTARSSARAVARR